MLVYIYTPIYKNSKYLPHLVEHCVINQINTNISTFLHNSYDVEGDCYPFYTVFFVPNYYDIDVFLQQITKPIEKDSIKYEQKIIREELEYYNYHQKLYENASKQIYSNKINNTETKKTTFQEVINYHHNYYQKENMIICNDNFNIFSNQGKKIIPYKEETNFKLNNITKKTIISSYIKTKLIFKEYNTRKDYYFMFFLEILLETWWTYIHRYKGGIYSYKHQLLSIMPQHILLTIPNKNNTDITEKFFQEYKQYFLQIIKQDYGKKGVILNFLIIDQYIIEKNILKFIKKIQYQDAITLLQKI